MSDSDLNHVASAARLADDDAVAEFNERTRLVYRCESCGRLHIYWDREQTWPPSVYTAEPDAYPHA
jgi:hypothetical protein